MAPIQRHKFSRDILRRVRQCQTTNNWHAPLETAEHWLFIGSSVYLSLLAWQHLPLFLGLVVYLFAVFLIGGRQRALAGILHQAVHGSAMRRFQWGRVLGTLFSGYTVFQSFSGYHASHVRAHHRRLANALEDPDYRQYQRYGLCGSGLTRSSLNHYLRSIIGFRSTISYIAYLLRDRILCRDEAPAERTVRLAVLAILLAVFIGLGWTGFLVAYWLVPLVTTQVWIGALAELCEHYPMIETAERTDLTVSRNRDCGRLSDLLLGEAPYEGYHLVHHLFPRVPLWRLKEVHAILLEDPAYAALSHPTGWSEVMQDLFAPLPGGEEMRSGTSAVGHESARN